MDAKPEGTDSPQGKLEICHDYMLKVDLIKCPGCKYESSTQNVNSHMKKLHMIGNYCRICDKEVNDRLLHWTNHILINIISHLKEQCHECSKLFMLESKRSEDEVFKCKECAANGSTTGAVSTPTY